VKIPLQQMKDKRFGIHWKESSPFIENTRAILIHRPRFVVTHKISEKYKSHIAIECWCGNSFTGTTKFTFLDVPPENKLLCARCESVAVKHGQPSAYELTGKHIHLGRLVPQQVCCI